MKRKGLRSQLVEVKGEAKLLSGDIMTLADFFPVYGTDSMYQKNWFSLCAQISSAISKIVVVRGLSTTSRVAHIMSLYYDVVHYYNNVTI